MEGDAGGAVGGSRLPRIGGGKERKSSTGILFNWVRGGSRGGVIISMLSEKEGRCRYGRGGGIGPPVLWGDDGSVILRGNRGRGGMGGGKPLVCDISPESSFCPGRAGIGGGAGWPNDGKVVNSGSEPPRCLVNI